MFSCDVNGNGSEPMGLDGLHVYFAESHLLWGLAPKRFIYVNDRPPPTGLTLREAVRLAERKGAGTEFVLAGYQDGGLISVSHDKQAFQTDAQPADWWRPVP
jgi:hypothetical protein